MIADLAGATEPLQAASPDGPRADLDGTPPARSSEAERIRAIAGSWPVGVWAIAAFALVLIVWYVAFTSNDFVHRFVADIAFAATAGLSAAVCLATARRMGDRGRAWTLLGYGALSWFLGQLVWNWYDLIRREAAPYPSLADVGYLLMYPFFAVALVLLLRRNAARLPIAEVLLDGAIVAVAGGTLFYKLLVGPLFGTAQLSRLALATSIAWQASTLTILFLALALAAWRSASSDPRPLILLVLGMASFGLGNVVYGRMALEGVYYAGHPIDLTWHLGFLAIAAAALVEAGGDRRTADHVTDDLGDPSATTRLVATAASVVVVTWLAAYFAFQPNPDHVAGGSVALIGTLLAGRLVYSHLRERELAARTRERDRLERAAAVAAAAEAATAERAEELARSNAELEQFAYVASHDLQEPLRMVSSYTQLLAKRYRGKLDADADEFIGYAVDGVTRMQQLINDLLAYSRVGRKEKAPSEVDLDKLLARAVANLGAAIQESGAVVEADPLPTLCVEPIQMTQVLQNLIGNAIKFRGDRAPVIRVAAERDGAFWRIAVRDNGIGIEPQYADRIFLLFQRLHTRDEYQGTGIGLAICRKIVERHGGRIGVESEPGVGSTFWLTLPALQEATHP